LRDFYAEDAVAFGPRIVARCLMSYQGLHITAPAQVRVAYALVLHSARKPKASRRDWMNRLV
jgi:hypothetical protein